MNILEPVLLRKIAVILCAALLYGCGRQDPETLFAAGKELLAKREYGTAAIQVKNGLQMQPESPEGRFLLGKILLEAGDASTAIVELRRARELRYSSDAVTPLILRANFQLRNYDKVVEEADPAKMLTKDAKVEVLTTLASAYTGLEKRAEARKAIDQALALQPDNASARLVQARLNLSGGDLAGTLAVVDSVIAKDAANFEAHKLKGDVLGANDKYEAAVASYRKAIELQADSIPARVALIFAHMSAARNRAGSKPFEEAVAQYEELKKRAPNNPLTVSIGGQLAFAKQDYRAAREFAQRLLGMASQAPAVLQFAGAVEYSLGGYEQAESYFAKALTSLPKSLIVRRWLAMTYLKTGRTDKAIATLEQVMPEVEKDAEMMALAGDVYLQSGNFAKAEEMLVKATKLAPSDPAKRVALAVVRINKGDSEAAYAELEKISSADKSTLADQTLIAAHLRRGDLDKALKAIDVFARKEPGNSVIHNLRGRVLLAKGRDDDARKSFERTLELNPALYSAVETLANLDVKAGKAGDAARRLEAFIAANPKNVQALLGLASLKARTSGSTPEEVLALYDKAVAADPADPAARSSLINFYRLRNDFKKAIAAGQDAAVAVPDNFAVLDALGQAQRAAGEINQALATYGKLVSAQPNSVETHLRFAEIYTDRKDFESAIASMKKVLAIRPDLIAAQRTLISLYLDGGKLQEALAFAREAKKQRPKDGFGYFMEGEIFATRKSYAEAIQAYREGLKTTGSSIFADKLHAVLLLGGKAEEADKFASEWTREHPKDQRFNRYLVEAMMARGNFQEAYTRNLELLKAEPDNPPLLNNMAFLASRLKRPGALEYAEKANKLAPNQPQLMDTLAVLLAESGDVARALDLITKAKQGMPQNPTIRFNYANILVKAGKKPEARKELEELAKLGDKFPAHAEVANLLKSL